MIRSLLPLSAGRLQASRNGSYGARISGGGKDRYERSCFLTHADRAGICPV